ncbi:MAG: bacteriohemerythrin [Spirochaetia bacterium]
MAIIEWKLDYSVGVSEINEQHKHLMRLINDMNFAIKNESDPSLLEEFMEEMYDAFASHFAKEQEWMASMNYPDEAFHELLHALFLRNLEYFKNCFISGNCRLTPHMHRYICHWFDTHILQSDKPLGEFLNSQGVY